MSVSVKRKIRGMTEIVRYVYGIRADDNIAIL